MKIKKVKSNFIYFLILVVTNIIYISVYAQTIVITPSASLKHSVEAGVTIEAEYFVSNISQEVQDKVLGLKNIQAHTNFRIIEFLPGQKVFLVVTPSSTNINEELKKLNVNFDFTSFNLSTNNSKPPEDYFYDLKGGVIAGLLKLKYFIIAILIILILSYIFFPKIYSHYLRKKNFKLEQETAYLYLQQLAKNRNGMEEFFRKKKYFDIYLDFPNEKFQKWSAQIDKIQYQADWNAEEAEELINQFNNIINQANKKTWNTYTQIISSLP